MFPMLSKEVEMGILRDFPEEFFEGVQDLAQIGFWEYSPKTHKLKCSPSVFDIHEFPREEYLDFDKAINSFLPSHRDMVQRKFLELIRRGISYDLEGIIITPSGKKKWIKTIAKPVLKDGEVVDVIGIFQDITRNKLLDIEGEKAKMRLNLSLSITKIGVWDWDYDNNVLYWDDNMFEIYEVKKVDFTGEFSFLEKLSFPEDFKRAMEDSKRALSTGAVFSTTFRIRTPGGKVKHIAARGNVDRLHENGTWLSGINWDVTQEIETQEKLRMHEARMISSARNSNLGEMAGGIAHEINNPLAIIQAKAESLKNRLLHDFEDKDKIISGLQLIEDTSGRIVKIINGLKNFSRDSDHDLYTRVPIREVLENVLGLVSQLYQSKGIEVRVEQREEVLVLGKAPELGQVIMNLLNNSFEALEPLSEKWILIEVSKTQKEVSIRITDSGPGIDPLVQEKMMQPFFTTKDLGKGMGLGLSISKGIIESHGGKFLYDKDHERTSFVVELPLITK